MFSVKSGLQTMARRLGYEIRRLPAAPAAPAAAPANPWHWLQKTLRVRTVLDVGANNGDFAAFLQRLFRPDRLILFEPQPRLAALLRARFAPPAAEVFSVALGARPGPARFYHNAHDPSSSLLPVSEHSKEAFPQTAHETLGQIEVARLDDLVDADSLAGDTCIKIDVQGAEDQVLEGGRRVFAQARCVYVEASFVPMYQGQPLFEEVHARLVDLGYRLAGIKNQLQAASGQPLFAHGFYLRQP